MSDSPLTLGFDTSAAACRVALMRGERLLAHHVEEMSKGQAERLMALCSETLSDTGLTPQDLSGIGVGIGPGNFTGIRIAVAAARGLALGLGVPAIGVSSFDALRHGYEGACACAVDARRGSVYLQRFDALGNGAEPILAEMGQLPKFDGPLIGAGGVSPAHPTAVAICHLVRNRLNSPGERPAPLYLRPADAAPARDTPPNLLT